MMLGETVRVAFQSIREHKLRALLTMLGIIIGVGAVIAVVAIGTGAQRAIQARIQALGANLLTIYPGQMFMGGRASDVRVSLMVRDAEALQRDAKLLSAVEPELQRSLQIKYGNMNFNINVLGTTPNYADVRNYTVPYGRMFTQGDDGARQRYAVLGSAVPAMFNANPAGLIVSGGMKAYGEASGSATQVSRSVIAAPRPQRIPVRPTLNPRPPSLHSCGCFPIAAGARPTRPAG